MLANSLCIGNVWHKRFEPRVHEFQYKLNMWLIDIDRFEDLAGNSRILNTNKTALYRFKPEKYLRDEGNYPISDKLKKKLTELGATIDSGDKFYLLGQLSNLGLYFSPLNLYLVVNDIKQCKYILAEVSNTPWNERYYYLLDKSQKQIISTKKFHVSPFFGMNQEYHWSFDFTEEKLAFKIDTYENERKVFSAGFSGKLINAKENNFYKRVFRSPLNVYKIIAGIYFEAFRLWFIKKIPFIPHPK